MFPAVIPSKYHCTPSGGTETEITLCAAFESWSFQITVLFTPTTTVSVGGSKWMLEFAPTPWGMTI